MILVRLLALLAILIAMDAGATPGARTFAHIRGQVYNKEYAWASASNPTNFARIEKINALFC